jgi:PAS domain S-box-containing protein
LAIGHNQPHKWLPGEIDLLQTIANQVGTVLENARLFAQARQRVQELDGLARISTALVANLDPRAVAEVAAEATQKLLGVDVVDLSLLQEGKLYRMAARIGHSGVPLSAPIVLGELVVPLVEQRESLIVHDIAQATAPALARELMAPRGLRSLLVVPLVTREQVIGMLAVVHSQARVWTAGEQGLLQTIANQVASAIDSAQLYQTAVTEQRKVQAIFDSGLSGLFATDATGRIVMFNRAAERVTGWTFAEVVGKSWKEFLSDHAVGNPVESLMEQALQYKKTTYAFEGRKMRTKDGRVLPVAKATAPLLDEKENVIGAVGAFWDLSKEQRAEIEYENFLTMIAHQLRSPLSSVLSALELFERRNLSDARRADLWAIIKTEGNQLKRLADQFLEHETALKATRPVKLEGVSIARVARQLVRQLGTVHTEHHFQVRVSRPEPRVLADLQGVENVLRNLLDNAAIYSPPDSPINVRIKTADPDWVTVSVQDFGMGIPLSEQPHLFQPFYRVPQTSARRVYGHGLGLALAKEAVEAMGGKIWVESEAGQGAIFHFTLRRAQ